MISDLEILFLFCKREFRKGTIPLFSAGWDLSSYNQIPSPDEQDSFQYPHGAYRLPDGCKKQENWEYF